MFWERFYVLCISTCSSPNRFKRSVIKVNDVLGDASFLQLTAHYEQQSVKVAALSGPKTVNIMDLN